MDLDEMLIAPPDVVAWQLADAELLRLVPELSLRMRQLEALRVRLMHQVDQRCVAEQVGASSPGNWLAEATTMTPGQANKIVKLGREMANHPEVAAAFDAGETDYDQVRVIVELLNKVPEPDAPARTDDNTAAETDADSDGVNVFDIVGPDATRSEACARYLLYAARTEDSTVLARRAKALALLLCEDDKNNPDSENAELNEFYASPGLGGRVHLKGHFDAASGEALLTALSALSKPHPGADNRNGHDDKDQRTPAQRRADALTHIVRSYLDSGQASTEVGERPHVNVFVDADDLAATTDHHRHQQGRRRGPAWMPWLGPISLGLAAQISCDADITPIAMDSDGNPLDVGRTTRLIPRKLRRALNARDCGCAFPGCGRPAAWTEGHHIQHWSNGGPTNLSNLVLLCRFHHTTIHRGDWTVHISTDDHHPWFTPPQWIDPQRKPVPAHNRRNQLPFAA